jgi:hypothetical protein
MNNYSTAYSLILQKPLCVAYDIHAPAPKPAMLFPILLPGIGWTGLLGGAGQGHSHIDLSG